MTKTSDETKQKIKDKFLVLDQRGNILTAPFVVSEEKKTLFFHIAKTGGSSIDHLLKKNGLNDNVLDNMSLSLDTRKEYFEQVVDEWDDYYKFTFVRNKHDQLISLYNYDLRSILNGMGFSEFIKSHVAEQSNLYPLYDYWIDQSYLTTVDGEEIFDFIGRFENYVDDLKTVCEKIGVEYEDVRKNQGSYDRKKKHSYYDEELGSLVYNRFSKEFEQFVWSPKYGQ